MKVALSVGVQRMDMLTIYADDLVRWIRGVDDASRDSLLAWIELQEASDIGFRVLGCGAFLERAS
jgi:hypothetical protein